MPEGPPGEKSPGNVIGAAIKDAKSATEEEAEEHEKTEEGKSKAAVELGRKGGKTRAERMSAERRREIARKAAAKRWGR